MTGQNAASARTPDGWQGILEPDERILWQGRPDPRFRFEPSMLASGLFGLFFAGFALFWMIGAAGAGGFFWMFGLIHFTVGLGVLAGPFVWPTLRRRNTWYTLTSKRAFIATELPLRRKSLKSYILTRESPVELLQGDLTTIYFADERKRSGKRGYKTVPIGFENLADGLKVYRLIQDVQTGQAL